MRKNERKKITFMTKQLVKKTLSHTTYSMDCQKRRIWLFLTTICLFLIALVCSTLSVMVVNAKPSRILVHAKVVLEGQLKQPSRTTLVQAGFTKNAISRAK